MSEPKPSLLEFPCDFPIKVFGLNRTGLEAMVLDLVRRHAPDIMEEAMSSRTSGGGKYTSLTITVGAQSQTQLDAIYRELTACADVIMAL